MNLLKTWKLKKNERKYAWLSGLLIPWMRSKIQLKCFPGQGKIKRKLMVLYGHKLGFIRSVCGYHS